jgi:hypothetical protein
MRKHATRAGSAFDRLLMVTAMVTFDLTARARPTQQPKFHHARRLEPDVGPEWAKGAGKGPALAFA